MPYKNKYDLRYRAARMRWYYANKSKHLGISNEIAHQKKKYLNELKGQPCADCGKNYPFYVMDFDHRDRSTKAFNIGHMLRQGWGKIKTEVEKCDVVCANCHRIRTYKDMAH